MYESDGTTVLGVYAGGGNAALERDAGAMLTAAGPAEPCMRTMGS